MPRRPLHAAAARLLPPAVLAAGLLTLPGCGEPTLDATDDGTLNASLKAMREGKTPEQRDALEEAVQLVRIDVMRRMENSADGLAALTEDRVERELQERLDGLTAAELLAEGEAAVAAEEADRAARVARAEAERAEFREQAAANQAARERERDLKALTRLTEERTALNAAEAEPPALTVVAAHPLEPQSTAYSEQPFPVVEVTVANPGDAAVTNVSLRGFWVPADAELGDTGNSSPSVAGTPVTLGYRVPPGIKPGTDATHPVRLNLRDDLAQAMTAEPDGTLVLRPAAPTHAGSRSAFSFAGGPNATSPEAPAFVRDLAAKHPGPEADAALAAFAAAEAADRSFVREAVPRFRDAERIRLEAARETAAADRALLDTAEIRDVDFSFVDRYGRRDRILSFTVGNPTHVPVRDIAFSVALTPTDGTEPARSDDLSLRLNQTIPPGETAPVSYFPGGNSDALDVPDTPAGYTARVTLRGFSDNGGNPVRSATFSDWQQRRLDVLSGD